MDDANVISVELERLLVRELHRNWHELNQGLFRGAMAPPVLRLVDARERLGRWVLDERAIELSRPLIYEQPWGAVVEVLKHEMAHQFVHEVMGVLDDGRPRRERARSRLSRAV
jgi:predicted SprT family Zn-dependent metalloprotease